MTQSSDIEQVGVIGAGTMGIGGAHAFAAGGLPVVLVDTSAAALKRARAEITNNVKLYGLIDRRQRAVSPDEVLDRIAFTIEQDRLANVGFVVENITENWALKRELYQQIDQICRPDCVFGVNTSAIPITKLAALTNRPDRVIGTHLMNPVPLKSLVEVIRGFHTSPETVEVTRALFGRIRKDIVVVEDSPGFVTNRVAMLSVNEAIWLLQNNVANAADIDRLFRQCLGHQMGPLETADLIGLDTVLYSLEVLLDNLKDQKFRPAPLLCKLVAAGQHGRKTGNGFYRYEQAGAETRTGVR